jgi:hypothetical protein
MRCLVRNLRALAIGAASAPRLLEVNGSFDVTGGLTPPRSPGYPILAGCLVSLLLLVWNGLFSRLASPFVLTHRLDTVQYQLLARNRLHGHYEVGEEAHTVHEEGRHPLWRPGLVWIQEGLARCLGSVGQAADAAAALGTTLLELALLCLAWRCYGRKTVGFLLLALLVPETSFPLLGLAVGQGPEVWAAAATVSGLAVLVEGLRRRSVCCVLIAGIVAGGAEWFRTGNLLLFAVPCTVYAVFALWQRDRRGVGLPAGALLAWFGMVAVGGMAVPSAVNKTVANLWACRTDLGGPWITEKLPDGRQLTYSLASYSLVPGTNETYLDHSLRSSRGRSTLEYCGEHAGEITRCYLQHLEDVVKSGFRTLRQTVGVLVLTLFTSQLLFCLPRCREWHTPALAGAALAQYLGPIVLIVGDEPSHYLVVAYPLFLLVATRGAVALGDAARLGGLGIYAVRLNVALGLAVFLITLRSILIYKTAATELRTLQQQARQEQAAVDALELTGKRVVCRNMSWFVDRDVQTLFLPYATVPELERYVQAHGADGVLIWESEPMAAFRVNPYGTPLDFGRALVDSGRFGPPRVSGAWRWYPVRHKKESQ